MITDERQGTKMLARLRSALTYANVVSTVCLFIVLGGVAYAGTQLANKSVDTRHLKDGAVTSLKVRDGNLADDDFRPADLPPAGYARIPPTDGPAEASKGVTGFTNGPGTSGSDRSVHCFDLAFVPKHAVANSHVNNAAVVATAVAPNDAVAQRCPAGHRDAVVRTYGSDGTPVDDVSFSVVFFK